MQVVVQRLDAARLQRVSRVVLQGDVQRFAQHLMLRAAHDGRALVAERHTRICRLTFGQYLRNPRAALPVGAHIVLEQRHVMVEQRRRTQNPAGTVVAQEPVVVGVTVLIDDERVEH